MSDISEHLAAIRKAMSAALKRNDITEYHRLGAEHRRILHTASPETKRAWERAASRPCKS
jgi:hypothetical protein